MGTQPKPADSEVLEETPAPVVANVDEFAEEVKTDVRVVILRGPIPVTNDKGTAIGTASIQKIDEVDYKTKQPTGEKLVWLAFQPNQGRAVKMRWSHAVAAVHALEDLVS